MGITKNTKTLIFNIKKRLSMLVGRRFSFSTKNTPPQYIFYKTVKTPLSFLKFAAFFKNNHIGY